MKKFYFLMFLLLSAFSVATFAQGGFTIESYKISVEVTKNASLKVREEIKVFFSSPRHGIKRWIPYKYNISKLPSTREQANMEMISHGKRKTIIENISVEKEDYQVDKEDDYIYITIGDKNKTVEGEKTYILQYTVLNAINFFKDKSELYWNLIGDQWKTRIDEVNFSIILPEKNTQPFSSFIATGIKGSTENSTGSNWTDDHRVFFGSTIVPLYPGENITIGLAFPKDYLIQPDYFNRNIHWLVLPLITLVFMFLIWNKYGKDKKLTIMAEYFPPKGISPGICGYVIDNTLDRRDLTALIPYWGAGGYLKVKEIAGQGGFLSDLNKDFEFTKTKELPDDAMDFEKTLFNGIFASGDVVLLSDLKNVLYSSMNLAKQQLLAEVDRRNYYVKNSRGMMILFVILGGLSFIFGLYKMIVEGGFDIWIPVALMASGIITIIFGSLMVKKTDQGNELYMKLAGFKLFIKTVEQPKLEQFLKEEPGYFDKVLPFAIVFDVVNNWQDKLKGMEVQPPDWYSGNFSTFTTYAFLSSLNSGLNSMSESFYSTPSSSAGSGDSWSDGGGSSGDGFGGGGGDSW